MEKPIGTFQCMACGNTWDGHELYQDPASTGTRWTCGNLQCGANVRKISDEASGGGMTSNDDFTPVDLENARKELAQIVVGTEVDHVYTSGRFIGKVIDVRPPTEKHLIKYPVHWTLSVRWDRSSRPEGDFDCGIAGFQERVSRDALKEIFGRNHLPIDFN